MEIGDQLKNPYSCFLKTLHLSGPFFRPFASNLQESMQKFRHLKCTTSVCVLNELAGTKSSPHQDIFAMQNMRLLFCLVFLFPTSLCGVLVFDSVSRHLLRCWRAWARLKPGAPRFVTHNFVTHTHNLSHTTLSHATLSHTLFDTQLCHTPSLSHTIFVTHNFVTHHTLSPTIFHKNNFVTHPLWHTTLSPTIFHTQLCHTNTHTQTHTHTPSPRHFAWQAWHLVISTFTLQKDATLSHTTLHIQLVLLLDPPPPPSFPVPATPFVAHYWKKSTCGVIRSFNFFCWITFRTYCL